MRSPHDLIVGIHNSDATGRGHTSITTAAAPRFRIGADASSSNHALTGVVEEVRLSLAARYSGPYTPATAPFGPTTPAASGLVDAATRLVVSNASNLVEGLSLS